jgi:hypothetical protein
MPAPASAAEARAMPAPASAAEARAMPALASAAEARAMPAPASAAEARAMPAPASAAEARAMPALASAARPRPSPRAAELPAAPRPLAAEDAPPAVAAAPAAKKDEVDDLLRSLDGKGQAAAPAAAPSLPEHLDRADILRVVKARSEDIRRCRERQPGASGVVTIHMVIAATGAVTTAAVTNEPFRGTPVGRCAEDVARTFHFPAFQGEPMTVNLPFAF